MNDDMCRFFYNKRSVVYMCAQVVRMQTPRSAWLGIRWRLPEALGAAAG